MRHLAWTLSLVFALVAACKGKDGPAVVIDGGVSIDSGGRGAAIEVDVSQDALAERAADVADYDGPPFQSADTSVGAGGAGGSVSGSTSTGTGGTRTPSGGTGSAGSSMSAASGGAGGSSASGMSCSTASGCPSGSSCCDRANHACDGIKLPTGNGTNAGQFVVSSDGLIVTDTITGLDWQRDGEGTRPGCSGEGTLSCTWDEAKSYCENLSLGGFTDWHLPKRMELRSIVDFTRFGPAIDLTVFPSKSLAYFWTSSPIAGSSTTAWHVFFWDGVSNDHSVSSLMGVRCVRVGAAARCYPNTRFVVLADGLVSDTVANLVWQQQASDSTMDWAAARSYCKAPFRLPTIKELSSLVDGNVAIPGPTIDQTAFPNTPADSFWSSSPYARDAGFAWMVSFYGGYSYFYVVSSRYWVRCVR